MGVPQQLDGLFHGKSHSKVGDLGILRYPHVRKPPDKLQIICKQMGSTESDGYSTK